MLSPVRLSVRLFVTWAHQSKMVEVKNMYFSAHGSPHRSSFAGKVLSRNSNGFSLSEGAEQRWGVENKLYSTFMRQYLEIGTRYGQSYIFTTNRKLHILFRLALKSMTLDDLDL